MCEYCQGTQELTLKSSKTSFTPCHTITGKGIAYVRPFNSKLHLRPVEVEFEKKNSCCLEGNNASDSTDFHTVMKWHILMPDQRA